MISIALDNLSAGRACTLLAEPYLILNRGLALKIRRVSGIDRYSCHHRLVLVFFRVLCLAKFLLPLALKEAFVVVLSSAPGQEADQFVQRLIGRNFARITHRRSPAII